mgnify:CR=1 FL=1
MRLDHFSFDFGQFYRLTENFGRQRNFTDIMNRSRNINPFNRIGRQVDFFSNSMGQLGDPVLVARGVRVPHFDRQRHGADRSVHYPFKFIQAMLQSLLQINYLNPQNPEHIMRSFRQMFGRAGLDERDVRILRGLMSEIDRVEEERRQLAGDADDSV